MKEKNEYQCSKEQKNKLIISQYHYRRLEISFLGSFCLTSSVILPEHHIHNYERVQEIVLSAIVFPVITLVFPSLNDCFSGSKS